MSCNRREKPPVAARGDEREAREGESGEVGGARGRAVKCVGVRGREARCYYEERIKRGWRGERKGM